MRSVSFQRTFTCQQNLQANLSDLYNSWVSILYILRIYHNTNVLGSLYMYMSYTYNVTEFSKTSLDLH